MFETAKNGTACVTFASIFVSRSMCRAPFIPAFERPRRSRRRPPPADATTVRRYAAAGGSSRFLLRISGGRIPRHCRLLELHVRLDPEQERLRQRQAEYQGTPQQRVAHLRVLKGIPPQEGTEKDQGDT